VSTSVEWKLGNHRDSWDTCGTCDRA